MHHTTSEGCKIMFIRINHSLSLHNRKASVGLEQEVFTHLPYSNYHRALFALWSSHLASCQAMEEYHCTYTMYHISLILMYRYLKVTIRTILYCTLLVWKLTASFTAFPASESSLHSSANVFSSTVTSASGVSGLSLTIICILLPSTTCESKQRFQSG